MVAALLQLAILSKEADIGRKINQVTIEMDERLKGTWQTTEEDEALQQRFWSLFKSSDWHGVIRSRIGRDFLRQNKELLE